MKIFESTRLDRVCSYHWAWDPGAIAPSVQFQVEDNVMTPVDSEVVFEVDNLVEDAMLDE